MKEIERVKANNINWKIVRKFLEFQQEFEGVSAADIVYSLYVNPDVKEAAKKVINDIKNESDEEKALRKSVEKCAQPEELVNLMRKPMSLSIKDSLWKKLLQNEEKVLPLIKEKCMRNSFDVFIENATEFFIRCEANCADWIVENYTKFRSDYLRSMLCLVLGFRGEVDLIPFLMEEAERLSFEYSDEDSYERGPMLAVQELYYRFKASF